MSCQLEGVPPEHIIDLFVAIMRSLFNEKLLTERFGSEVSPTQAYVLRFLNRHEDANIGTIATGLRISYPAATKTVDRLTKKGLADRQSDPHDRRTTRVLLTERGRSLIQSFAHEQVHLLTEVLDRMGNEHKEAFLLGVRRFIEAVLETSHAGREICLECGKDHSEDCPLELAIRHKQEV